MKPIYFHEETLKWLGDHQPWPPSLVEDLNQITKHNQKVEGIR